MKLKAEY